ncbi:MAG: hypothetical protein HUK02_09795 [Bacteroidaceae bacterium]|nr:hypothetical protein [Bacteroidaceae bacterium]
MKKKNIFMLLALGLATLTFTACMDKDWETPDFTDNVPYGNNEIQATNVINIAQLKALYPNYNANYTCTEMKDDAQLKVYVTGNDIMGNLYNSIAVQDDNGDALIVAISESSLFGYLPVGQELLIDLKGLYIGGYGSQAQIGMPYKKNEDSDAYVSRMNSNIWQKHFKLLPSKHKVDVPEYTVDEFKKLDIEQYCGRLMKLKNVSIKGLKRGQTWASTEDAGTMTSVTLYFNELSTTYEVYTSTYCDFANTPIPEGKMNLTGIWKRYNKYWELIIRDINDIEAL